MNQIISEKFKIESEKSSVSKIIRLEKLAESLGKLQKKLLVLSNHDIKAFELQELGNSIDQIAEASKVTLKNLLITNPSYTEKFHELESLIVSLRNQRNFSNESSGSYFSSLLSIISKQEELKQTLTNFKRFETEEQCLNSLKEKIYKEQLVIRSLCEVVRINCELPMTPANISLKDCINIDKQHLEIYKKCLEKLSPIESFSLHLTKFIRLTIEIGQFVEKFRSALKPRDKSLDPVIEKLNSEIISLETVLISSELTGQNILSCFESQNELFEIVISSFNEYLVQLPQVFPAIVELNSLAELMKDSNFTIQVLANYFGKQDKYKSIIDPENIPKIDIDVERDFSLRWKWMIEYIKRVSEAGLHLEHVKRSIINDGVEVDKISRPFNDFAKNLYETENALARLVQALPFEDFEEGSQKLQKLSKNRVSKLKNAQKNKDLVGLNDIEDLCEIHSDFNTFFDDLIKSLSINSLVYSENSEIPELLSNPLISKATQQSEEVDTAKKEYEDSLKEIDLLQQANHQLQQEIDTNKSKIQLFERNLEGFSDKIAEIFAKTNKVGNTLMEVIPEDSLKQKIEDYQKEYEEIISDVKNNGKGSVESIHKLLDLLNLYEAANGVGSSRLAEVSENPAEERDKVSTKINPSMKKKKNLRSGKPNAASSSKPTEEVLKETALNGLKLFDPESVQEYEEYEYEEISRKLFSSIFECSVTLQTIETQREEILVQEINFCASVDGPHINQLNSLKDSLVKARIDKTDSFNSLLAKSKLRLLVEKAVSKIRLDLGFKENLAISTEEIENICHEAVKFSIETLKQLGCSDEEITLFREKTKNMIISGNSGNICNQTIEFLKVLIEMELTKQNTINYENNSSVLSRFLTEYQLLFKRNSANLEKLWAFLFKVLGNESDKIFLKGLIISLPIPGEVFNPISLLQESQLKSQEFVEKNEKKIKEMETRNEDLINNAGEIEESFDDIIRGLFKEISTTDDEKLKKQTSDIKEEFDEISNKTFATLTEKLNHLSLDFLIISKLDKIKKTLSGNTQKTIKKLENDLNSKKNELETLISETEAHKKALSNKIEFLESSLKETRISFEKISKEKYEKELEIVSISNNVSDLLKETLDLKEEINKKNEEITDAKLALRTTRKNLSDKNEEVSRLEEIIRENEGKSPKSNLDENTLNNFRQEINSLNSQVVKKQKELDLLSEDYQMIKRDLQLLKLDAVQREEVIKSQREELGHLKVKILTLESTSRDLEEKNKLGVDRNDSEINKLVNKLLQTEQESLQLKRQLEPSLNYRKLYTDIRSELELQRQEKESYEVNLKSLKQELNSLIKENESLRYDNRMMEKYKKE